MSLCEIGKVQGGKSISAQELSSQPHCQGSSYYSQCIYFSHTKPNGSVPTVRVQRHKDLLEYIDLAHAA